MTTNAHRLAPGTGWGTGWATGRIEGPAVRAGSTLVRKLGAALQAVQYAQMVSALNQLPDACLNETGLRRVDIPEHARRTIYGDPAAGSRARG